MHSFAFFLNIVILRRVLLDWSVAAGRSCSYLMDEDIGGILGRFVYDDVESVINDMNTVRNIFGSQQNRENCNEILSRFWHHWN